MMPPAWPGSRTSAASNSIPTPSGRAILTIPTNSASTSIPGPAFPGRHVRTVALEVKAFLSDMGLHGWPKTSGSRGMHINVRIQPEWTFAEVRRAAVALSRAVERRRPDIASSKWWKEERHGVFLDYNQNAKDRTTCSAYSVRPLPDARVSTPLDWREVPDCDPADFTIFTVPKRFATIGDPHADMDRHPGSLEKLLELADKDEAEGLADAPWPPHFRRAEGEAPRVAPSRARSAPKPRAKMPLITVANSPDRDAALAGLERWKAKYPAATAHLAVDDVLVDSMRGRSSTWTRIRVNLRHVPEDIRPRQETPDPDDDPTRQWRELRAGRGSKKATDALPNAHRAAAKIVASSCGGTTSNCSYVQSCGLLSVRHLRKCDMWRKREPCMCSYATSTTSSALQRLPGKILAAAPAALCPRHTASGFSVRRQMAHPLLPRVIVQCVRAIRRQKVQQFPSLLRGETRAHTHVLQHTRFVIKPKQQRPDGFVLRTLVPAKSRDYAIAFPLVLHFEHRPLVRFVVSRSRLGHHAIQACSFESPEPVQGGGPILCRGRKVNRWRRVPKDVLKHPPS